MAAQPKSERTDPLAKMDLGDFSPTPPAAPRPKPAPETIRAVSEAAGFPSREASPQGKSEQAQAQAPQGRPEQRRHRTGRNQQLTLKVSPECAARFARLSSSVQPGKTLVYGELLDLLMDSYEASAKK